MRLISWYIGSAAKPSIFYDRTSALSGYFVALLKFLPPYSLVRLQKF